jgi:hypothetical protein
VADVIDGGGNSDALFGLGVLGDVVFSPLSRPAPGEPGKFIDRNDIFEETRPPLQICTKHGDFHLQLLSDGCGRNVDLIETRHGLV